MGAGKPVERPAGLDATNGYTLLIPVEYQIGDRTERLERLQLRRLTGAELLILAEPGSYAEKLFRIIEGQTGLMRIVTLKIDAVDLDRIDEIFGYFREPGSVTGAIS